MIEYPSIPYAPESVNLRMHTWGKLDGSNLRWEWSKKRGWYKQGTRTRLFDETDTDFGEAIPVFHRYLSTILEQIFKKQRWNCVTVFTEFFGESSFAGVHVAEEPKQLQVIDLALPKRGLILPKEFTKIFQSRSELHWGGSNYLGYLKWNKTFLSQVHHSQIPDMPFEGVVGKAMVKNKLVMYKYKSYAWKEKVRQVFAGEADRIINS